MLTEATPSAVLIKVAHNEHKDTVIAEMMNDLGKSPLLVTYTALTTIVTSGSQARGETGLNIWIRGFKALITVLLNPQITPIGSATSEAMTNPINTVFRLVIIWSMYVGLPVYLIVVTFAFGFCVSFFAFLTSCFA